MLGQKDPANYLPGASDDVEKRFWTYGGVISSQNGNQLNLPEIEQTLDPCFPYEDGPGHTKATPQQLSTMWKMMREVGVSSFRPDFSTSPSSKDNKFLWALASRIFITLVDCGEYTGISLGSNGLAMIQKAMQARVRSLNKR